MRFAAVVGIGVASLLVGAATTRAQGLPPCGGLLGKAPGHGGGSEDGPKGVKGWGGGGGRGLKVVLSLEEADVVLEFNKFGHTVQFDGIPAVQWQFTARRLSEPNRERATHRFAFVSGGGPESTTSLSKQMPLILTDVCMGSLPRTTAAVSDQR